MKNKNTPENENTTLGYRIRTAREKAGIYQGKLAEMLGLTSGRIISNWENNVARPDADNIAKLCRALDVSAAYLIGYYGSFAESEQLGEEDHELIRNYRSLDDHGRDLIDTIMSKELERVSALKKSKVIYRDLPFFDYAASAGTGLYLDDVDSEIISVEHNDITANADFAIPVSGDSMEPKFFDGDRVCIKSCPSIEIGDIGIFIVNGEAFIKKFGGDRLISLNKKYADISFGDSDSVVCRGLVLGKI